MKSQVELALKTHQNTSAFDGFLPIVESLLVDYYDPDVQLSNSKKNRSGCL